MDGSAWGVWTVLRGKQIPTTTVERRYPVGGDGRSMTGGSVSNVSIPPIDRIGHMKVAHQAVTFLLGQDRRRCDADAGGVALDDRTHRPPGIHGRDEVVPSIKQDAAHGPSTTDRLHRLRGALTERLRDADGVTVIDHRANEGYVTPQECAGEDAVFISRIRKDPTVSNGMVFWCVSDNLRKGAALNSVQIAELVAERGLSGR